ncbi:MAG: methyltransferase domain-containing protein [Pseudomonadota bacterium]
MNAVETDWDRSAEAWLEEQGEHGDWARRHVLDRVMLGRSRRPDVRHALDVGCGEGRFCRLLKARGIAAIGIDPTERLLQEARARDVDGDYRSGRAEDLPFNDGVFDLVVSYLSLIDIAGLEEAIAELVRVCAPGGSLLIANLASYNTAGQPDGWIMRDGTPHFQIDHYSDHRPIRAQWRGMDIVNHHRPLAA